jgi:hypothetical protein
MNMYLFFSHNLTDEQIKDAKSMGIVEFISLPDELQYLWSNIPPELDSLDGYDEPFYEFLKDAKKGDFVLIQGDFGLVYRLVDFSKKNGLIPVYATTKRIAKEIVKNAKVIKISEFKHVKFRKY